MILPGMFLTFGETVEPAVYMLDAFQTGHFAKHLEGASEPEMLRIYTRTFAEGVQWAVPTWIPAALQAVFMDEKLPKKARFYAARLFERKPLNAALDLTEQPPTDGGGQEAKIDPVKPKPRKPSGGNAINPKSRVAQAVMA